MAIGNIVDRRSNCYDTLCNAVVEPSANDNPCHGSTTFAFEKGQEYFFEIHGTTVAEAIETVSRKNGPYTIYFYDLHLED